MAGLSTVQGGLEDPVLTYTVNAVGTANVLDARPRRRPHARRRQRDHRQGLPRPGLRVGLPRGRPARRLGPLLELEGLPGARDERIPRLAARRARHRRRERPRRQRDRRRRPDRRPPRPRPDPRLPRRHAARGARARRDPALAARHSARSSATCCSPSGCGRTPAPPPRGTSAPTRRSPARSAGWSSACARAGRARSRSRPASRSRGSRRRSRASTARAPAARLGWRPPWDLPAAIDATVDWHLAHPRRPRPPRRLARADRALQRRGAGPVVRSPGQRGGRASDVGRLRPRRPHRHPRLGGRGRRMAPALGRAERVPLDRRLRRLHGAGGRARRARGLDPARDLVAR